MTNIPDEQMLTQSIIFAVVLFIAALCTSQVKPHKGVTKEFINKVSNILTIASSVCGGIAFFLYTL